MRLWCCLCRFLFFFFFFFSSRRRHTRLVSDWSSDVCSSDLLPFFNVRFYMAEHTFSFDFYDDLGHPDYVNRFVESWNVFRRDPRLNHNAELRSTPLYFHVCPNCKVYILTNRDEGSNLNCRQCDMRNPTQRVQ